jgi:hypothetical protein
MANDSRTRTDAIVDALDLTVDILATYRLVKLVTDDKITEPFREMIFARYGDPTESKRSYLVTCPWCLGIYFGAGVALGRKISPNVWTIAARALALSTGAGLLAEKLS